MTDSTDRPVRTRYAPSPTGPQHIGGIRSALFGWLYARRHGGQFILRIEDTDQKRSVPGSLELILEAFDWLGLDIDEGPTQGGDFGPYIQSERLPLYQKWAAWLVEQGYAYKCFATAEELAAMRKAGAGYDRRYRDLPAAQVAELEGQGRPYVIRFKMPLSGKTSGQDMIRGEVSFDNSALQDAVLLKSDGFPTYHLAHIVDDHFMQISHITRAVEWLPSFPLHLRIWEAFAWPKPQFAHLPVLLNPNGKGKLSKRKERFVDSGKAVPVLVHEFMDAGYLPAAVLNFLTNIGWNYGDNQEIFSTAQAIKRFELEDVHPANSAYPIAKLDWLNNQYIQTADVDYLARALKPILEEAGYEVDDDRLRQVAPSLRVRLKTLKDVLPMAGFFFADWASFQAPPAEVLVQRKMDRAGTVEILHGALPALEQLDGDFSADAQHAAMAAYAKSSGYKNGQVFGSLRAAVSGQKVSPPTFDTMAIFGQAESIRRIKLAIEALSREKD